MPPRGMFCKGDCVGVLQAVTATTGSANSTVRRWSDALTAARFEEPA
jgi:hypothetical protein